MAEQEVVAAKPREGKFNKNAARRVRVAGMIPAVLYGAKEAAIAVELDPKQITRILHSESGHNTIFDLEIGGPVAGGARTKAMIVDWQYEPIKGKLMHIDLKRIAMDKAMRVKVPILLEGVPVGVKMQGGILDQVLREVEIECLPGDIPSHIDMNVSSLGLGSSIRVADLPRGGKLKFITDENATVAHIVSIKEEVAPVVDVVAAAAPVEPEVAKKGKVETPDAPAASESSADGERRGVALVVGLGNPGIEYQFTPHNAGFLAIDRLAQQSGVAVANRRCRALTATARIAGREVVLAKPETYMNLSGISVQALVKEFDADASRDLIVIYDEIALGLGSLRIRERGSSGGHNGVRSISGSLGSEEWLRIRIGVAPPGDEAAESARRGRKDYVLMPMRKAQLAILDEVLDRTARAVEMVLAQGAGPAMNEFNRREPGDE